MAYEDFDPGYLDGEIARLSAQTDRFNEGAAWEARHRRARAGLPADQPGDRPLHEVGWTERSRTPHYTDTDRAVFTVSRQLAERTGNTLETVLAAVDGLSTGRSEAERAEAVIALSGAVDAITADEDTAVISLSVLTQDERERPSAHTIPGTTDFPIPDKAHLLAAIARYRQGKLAGHSKSEVYKHIASRAKALGVSVNLDDDGDNDADHPDDEHEGSGGKQTVKTTGSPAAQLARDARPSGIYSASDVLRLAADRAESHEDRVLLLDAAELRSLADEQGMDAADAEVARLTRSYFPHEFGYDPAVSLAAKTAEERRADDEAVRLASMDFPGKTYGTRTHDVSHTQGKAHPGKPGRPVTTRTRAHSHPAEDASTDHHAEVQRYLRELQAMNGTTNHEQAKGGLGGLSRKLVAGKEPGCSEPGCDKPAASPRADRCAEHARPGYKETPAGIHKSRPGVHPAV